MSINFEVSDTLEPLKHTATALQLFRYSAVTWNPHRIHFDEPYAREEGHRGLALHSHLRAALALRCVTEGLGPQWRVTKFAYRLRKPVYAPTDLAYTARVRRDRVFDDLADLERRLRDMAKPAEGGGE